jgi:SAM-dependent methyltransferase
MPITETLRVPRSLAENSKQKKNDLLEAARSILKESSVVGFVGNPLDPICHELPQEVEKLVLISPLKEELATAQASFKKFNNIVYVHEKLSELRVEDECLDLLICFNSLEFEQDPQSVFDELVAKIRPEGWLWIEERDNSNLCHYPLAKHLEMQLFELAEALQKKAHWQPWIGRKLFSYISESDFLKIKTEVMSAEVICGQNSSDQRLAWEELMDQAQACVNTQEIQLSFDLKCFRREFNSFFENPHRFSYSPLIRIMAMKAP